jgi:hypothetical protein
VVKKIKKLSNMRMEERCVMHYLGKIPNMDWQCFPKESFTNFANKVGIELALYLSWRVRWLRRRALEGCIMLAKFSSVQTFLVSHISLP